MAIKIIKKQVLFLLDSYETKKEEILLVKVDGEHDISLTLEQAKELIEKLTKKIK